MKLVMVNLVIMAGGEGRRLRPLTRDIPKPMVPVLDKPLLEHIIFMLAGYGFREFILTLHYRPDSVIRYFRDGSHMGVRIRYSVERRPLGTAGGVKAALPSKPDDLVIVWSGDVVASIDLEELLDFHEENGADVTMAAARVEDPTPYGMIIPSDDMRVKGYVEKPGPENAVSNLVNAGIYVIEPHVIEMIPGGRPYDFSRDLFPRLIEEGGRMYAYEVEGYWMDVGSPERYLDVNLKALAGEIPVRVDGRQVGRGIWVGGDVEIGSATLIGPTYIGRGVEVGENSVLGPGAIVGREARIGRSVKIRESVLWPGAMVEENSEVMGSIVGGRTPKHSRVFKTLFFQEP